MIPVGSLVTFLFASVLLSIAPGPDNLFVLTQSALLGRKEGIQVTLGLCTGLIIHTLAVALGVAAIFKVSTAAFITLKGIGSVYLLYLAWQAFTASETKLNHAKESKHVGLFLYLRGIIMNVTNPKVSIFFLAFLPQFASPARGPLALQILILGGIFIVVALVVFSGIALLAGTLGTLLSQSPKIQVYLNRIAGTIFVGLALKLATAQL